ncbi:DNA repair protein recA [Citrus sinensis]|uniref:DNA repair protein recA n=1 Tax=Citrus sinensis TaxID=2711 RepID=A0ACB8HZC7_CITSI|nr:DNA repair protein recA [Citrus sinensis]
MKSSRHLRKAVAAVPSQPPLFRDAGRSPSHLRRGTTIAASPEVNHTRAQLAAGLGSVASSCSTCSARCWPRWPHMLLAAHSTACAALLGAAQRVLLQRALAPRSRSANTTPVRSRSVTTTLVRSRTVTNDLPSYDSVEVSEFDDELHGDAKIMEKDNALRRALSQLANDFGKESMGPFGIELKSSMISSLMLNVQELNDGSTCFYMEDFSVRAAAFIGRIVEIYGREASGETTLALHVIKEAQKLGGYCAYLDVENALDPCLAEAMGIDTENLLIVQPDSTENLLSVVDTLTKSGSIDVIVFDSGSRLCWENLCLPVRAGTSSLGCGTGLKVPLTVGALPRIPRD